MCVCVCPQVRCSSGEHIINQGEIGEVLYVVESGTYEAYLRQKGDDAVGRTRGRSDDAVGRTRGDAPREGGHRPVVTQGLEHEGSERRARGRGTCRNGNGK